MKEKILTLLREMTDDSKYASFIAEKELCSILTGVINKLRSIEEKVGWSVRDYPDKHQYCVDCLGNWFMYNRTYISLLNQTNVTWHKATKEEILKHFK